MVIWRNNAMLTLLWLKGILFARSGRLLGAILGVALTVALLTSLGAFLVASNASMTKRAVAGVPVDWQIQLSAGADPNTVVHALYQSTSPRLIEEMGYATVTGLSANTGGTVQTTGEGKVLGLSSQYQAHFPTELRLLIGSLDGVLVAQQTAANLHVSVGDTVTIQRPGLSTVSVPVAGIVDLPNADSLFQAIGVLAGIAPQAPPDNVLLMPSKLWHQLFDAQASVRPDSVHLQLHVQITRPLPSDPETALAMVQRQANQLEARIAGNGIVGNNLAARLDAVRQDALYARVLFLFLGLPGVLLAILLTMAVAASGTTHRRQEQALLRTRGASSLQILRLEATEAVSVGLGGVILGLVLARLLAQVLVSGSDLFQPLALPWVSCAALVGILLAVGAVLLPAWQQTRRATVVATRAIVGHTRSPLWQRLFLDGLLLIVATLMFWRTASTGYQVVLAPEGVAGSSVSYEVFLAPLCLWLGVALLALRLWELGLTRGRYLLSVLLRPVGHQLSGVVAASLGRQRVVLTRGMVLVALACSFATSTAIFNTTYQAQARVDANLTNGADVTVTGSAANPADRLLRPLQMLPGVVTAQSLQHRFAYVGNDLQDIYGIDPQHIGEATSMSNAFFAGGNAQATLTTLSAHPDGVLVSEETVMNFQLNPGDLINLRLQRASDHQYHVIPFHFLGVVREFPTAPKDSFLIANASYIGQQTGMTTSEVVLLRTSGNPQVVADRARALTRSFPGLRVTDIATTQRQINSSLTAVDVEGLTQLELVFALLLAVGATGLMLALGLAERRRTFAILTALGARRRHLGAFLWSEALVIQGGGVMVGILLGLGVAQMLVTILTGVFDPPPEVLSLPWSYLGMVIVAALLSLGLAVLNAQRTTRRPVVEAIRAL
jgi:putative ABC transport system permease protein